MIKVMVEVLLGHLKYMATGEDLVREKLLVIVNELNKKGKMVPRQ